MLQLQLPITQRVNGVTNPDTGAMEWHAADGSVVSQEQWATDAGSTSTNETEA